MPRMATRIVAALALALALASSGVSTTQSSSHKDTVLAVGCCRN